MNPVAVCGFNRAAETDTADAGGGSDGFEA